MSRMCFLLFFPHQEYSCSGAQCQRENWCFQGWMGCSHPVVGTRQGCLYVVALEREAKLETVDQISSVPSLEKALI